MLLKPCLVPALLALVLSACTSGAPSPADGGRPDAARDSASVRDSARPDTAVRDTATAADTGVVDSGRVDSGQPPLLSDLEWVRLEGQPTHCVVERAVNPSDVFDVHWLACPGVEACEYLDPTTTPLRLKILNLPGTFDGGEAYVLIALEQSDGSDNGVVAIVTVDSGVVLALRTLQPPGQRFACGIGNVALSPTSYALAVNDVVNHESSVYSQALLAPEVATPVAHFSSSEHGGSIVALGVSSSAVSGGLGGDRLFIIDGTRKRIIEPETGVLRGGPANVHVRGHDVIWEDWPGIHGTRLVHATIDTGPDLLVAPPEGVDVKSSFLSTSGWMAWYQGSEITPTSESYTYGRIEAWVADTRDMSNFHPRFLALLNDRPILPIDGPETYMADAVVGPDGPTDLTTTGEDSFRMYDLARRERRLFRKFDPSFHRPEFVIGDFVAESPTELFFNAGVGSPRTGTYVRLAKSRWLSSPAESLPDVAPAPSP